jgi:hypothetical protein
MGMPFAPPIGGKSIRKLTMFEHGLTSAINAAPCPPAAPYDSYHNNYGVSTYNGYAHQVDGLGSMSPAYVGYATNLARKSIYAMIDGVLSADIITEDLSFTGPAYESGFIRHATLATPTGGEAII